MIVISICLSDIPKEARTQAANGKIYANFVVDERREKDNYGNTHTVYINQSKEDRLAKKNKQYVGNGKEFIFSNNSQPSKDTSVSSASPSYEIEDDLPF